MWILFAFAAHPALAQDQAGNRAATPEKEQGQRDEGQSAGTKQHTVPPPLQSYMGREIATTMHYAGADWLIRDEREREERCSMMITNLGLRRGMTVCDMGCGNGYHTLRLADLVGPTGQVLAVDIQPEMLALLRDRIEENGVENVVPILGSYHHPRLPAQSVDLILLVDVYHEFSHPEQMLKGMRDSLKKEGVIVLVEFRGEDPDVPIKPLHKMTKAQINKELTANGFVLSSEFDGLPWQHMMFFKQTDEHRLERPSKSQSDESVRDRAKPGRGTLGERLEARG
jgi:SAM-dependent methyltransferase